MGKKQRPEEIAVGSGLALVDKPAGWTSHDVVARLRKLAGTRKVGHAGTLDPMATGVLVVGINKATRLLTHIVGVDKTYTATVRLGQTTTTEDAAGELVNTHFANAVTDEGIRQAISRLTGEIMQVPSSVSAIKVDGQRAYDRARSGEEVELEARPVTLHHVNILDIRRSDDGKIVDVDIDLRVSSGTYVRAFARDLGELVEAGGHLTTLRRTAVGPYREDQCLTLDQLAEDFGYVGMAEASAQIFPARQVSEEEAGHLRHGRRITASAEAEVTAPAEDLEDAKARREGLTAAFDPTGELVALLRDIPATAGASSSPDAAAAAHHPEAMHAKPELVFQ